MTNWISVKDKLPDQDIDILICDDEGNVKFGVYANWSMHYKFLTTNFEMFMDAGNITHWMPLPKPPKENK